MVVVDASFLMAVFVEETHTDFARGVMIDLADQRKVAPALVAWEFANILWKKRRKGEILDRHLADAGEFLAVLEVEADTSLPVSDVGRLAIFGTAHGLTAYDAAYLDLALVGSLPLATIDKMLTRAALAAGLVVHSPFA